MDYLFGGTSALASKIAANNVAATASKAVYALGPLTAAQAQTAVVTLATAIATGAATAAASINGRKKR